MAICTFVENNENYFEYQKKIQDLFVSHSPIYSQSGTSVSRGEYEADLKSFTEKIFDQKKKKFFASCKKISSRRF
jgi:hypothetical protein